MINLAGILPTFHSARTFAAKDTYLLGRRYAFIGGRGLRDGNWSPLFGLNVGHPLALCAEASPGV